MRRIVDPQETECFLGPILLHFIEKVEHASDLIMKEITANENADNGDNG